MIWEGIPCLPGSAHAYGNDILASRIENEEAAITITLMDVWVLDPEPLKHLAVAHWMPIDCNPLGAMDEACLTVSGAIPIAMSQFGEKLLQEADFSPLYVPHAVDTNVFKPRDNRTEIRTQLGIDDSFVIGINAANKDPFRKGISEQLIAFAKLHAKHPDTVLLIHGQANEPPNGLDTSALTKRLNITDCVRFANQYEHLSGKINEDHLVSWYNCLDLYSQASLGEGFGLTALEAQACGTPVVVTKASAMTEVAGKAGWAVEGEPFWNPKHQSWWTKPNIAGIYRAYEQAYQKGSSYQAKKKAALANAQQYSADNVMENYWKPTLKILEDSL